MFDYCSKGKTMLCQNVGQAREKWQKNLIFSSFPERQSD
jgi:hypothetical protein